MRRGPDSDDEPIELEDNSKRARAIRMLDLSLGISRRRPPPRRPSFRDCPLCGRANISREARICGGCAVLFEPTPLRRWRFAYDATLTTLARDSGVHYRTLLRADRGDRMSRDVAELLARHTGLSPSEFRDPEENEWLDL